MKYEKPYSDYKDLATPVSPKFKALAKRFKLAPEYLAFLVLSDFCDHPPDGLWLVSNDPSDARRD